MGCRLCDDNKTCLMMGEKLDVLSLDAFNLESVAERRLAASRGFLRLFYCDCFAFDVSCMVALRETDEGTAASSAKRIMLLSQPNCVKEAMIRN